MIITDQIIQEKEKSSPNFAYKQVNTETTIRESTVGNFVFILGYHSLPFTIE